LNYYKNNNNIRTKIIISLRWILCILRKIIILTTQIIIFFTLILRIVKYFQKYYAAGSLFIFIKNAIKIYNINNNIFLSNLLIILLIILIIIKIIIFIKEIIIFRILGPMNIESWWMIQ